MTSLAASIELLLFGLQCEEPSTQVLRRAKVFRYRYLALAGTGLEINALSIVSDHSSSITKTGCSPSSLHRRRTVRSYFRRDVR